MAFIVWLMPNHRESASVYERRSQTVGTIRANDGIWHEPEEFGGAGIPSRRGDHARPWCAQIADAVSVKISAQRSAFSPRTWRVRSCRPCLSGRSRKAFQEVVSRASLCN